MQTIFQGFKRLVKHFHKNEDGAVAMIYGPMALVLFLAAGVSVDYARGYMAKKEISRALDAAVLAAGSLPVNDEDAIRKLAKEYFEANLSAATKADYNPQLNLQIVGDDLVASSRADVSTFLMSLAGYDSIHVSESSVATRSSVNVEVALVLDNTGSMRGSKMTSLKSAAKTLIDTLYEAEGSEESVKIALVPFTGTVNVGQNNKMASWMDLDGLSIAAREDHGPDHDYWPRDPSLKNMTAFEVLDTYNVAWNGCVRERVGFARGPSGASLDLSLWDVPARASEPNTKFAPYAKPIYPLIRYATGAETRAANELRYDITCPTSKILPLTNQEDVIKSRIDSMVASGYTNVPIGLIWGWRVLSNGAPYSEGAPDSDKGTNKVIVLLTDGANGMARAYSSYGLFENGHLGASEREGLDDRLRKICINAKTTNILIYTITFAVTNPNIKTLMRNCASRQDMYFNSPNAGALEDAFDTIATGLQKLRLKK